MAKIDLAVLKTKFESGDVPTQADFVDLIDTLANESVTQGGLSSGSIIRSSAIAPANTARCNGSLLPISSNQPLYDIIGDSYARNERNGQPWRIQTSQTVTNFVWSTGTALPLALEGATAVVTNARVYLLGGVVSGSPKNTTYTAPINSDGTLGAWVAGGTLPGVVGYGAAFLTNSRVYLIAGGGTAAVYTAVINPDGTIGTWTGANTLTANITKAQVIVTNTKVYVLLGIWQI
jgi:hypothetical protein